MTSRLSSNCRWSEATTDTSPGWATCWRQPVGSTAHPSPLRLAADALLPGDTKLDDALLAGPSQTVNAGPRIDQPRSPVRSLNLRYLMAGVAGYIRNRAIRTNQYLLRRRRHLDQVLYLERIQI